MTDSYDLSRLDPSSFEHMANLLALSVLGSGHTGFGPGPDGGRDGYFEGEAPYPSQSDRWTGHWYIQSKFHKPHLSKDPQKWLLERIQEEIAEFEKSDTKRQWPDNWIVATNIDPSGAAMTGSFDLARKLVASARPQLKDHFHIWGGRKILDLLTLNPKVAEYYAHFLTPGHILTQLYEQIADERGNLETILRFLIVKQLGEQQYTKLEQAGSAADTRPGIHRLFIDLPFTARDYGVTTLVTRYLTHTSARCHRINSREPDTERWRLWRRHPKRARVWFIRGGPGQGKSTIGQYFCQIQRAALILQEDGPDVTHQQRSLAAEIKDSSEKAGFWPLVPRVPISMELREFAQWFGLRDKDQARGILTYLAERVSIGMETRVQAGTLRRALACRSWFAVFDGLDEVPSDVKDAVALEVRNFIDDIAVECNADLLTLCTSRPQGYSGQFSNIDGPTADLIPLSPEQALECAEPVVRLDRTIDEASKSMNILRSAITSSSVRELMTTPLQAHIMAVVVRDGGRPPDRRWALFMNFYQVIRRREANRNLPNERLAKLLREDEKLLKAVHSRLGFVLHARAETSQGAQTRLDRNEFQRLVTQTVSEMMEQDVDATIQILMEATTERLVLVNTPEQGNQVRFDIRPLQEFFAAEFLYEGVDATEVGRRMEVVAGDAHWREVMYFLLSALVENARRSELYIAISVLEALDDGAEEQHARRFRRRLGRGALLAARLLKEGVLEQDKRVRQHFRKCMEPLMAFTDFSELRALVGVTQPNSLAWLINFLVEHLRDASPNENIGAAIVLLYILPNSHEFTSEVSAYLLSASPEYFEVALSTRTLDLNEHSEGAKVQPWVVHLALCAVLRAEWAQLSRDGIYAALRILRNDEKATLAAARESTLPASHVQLLKCLLKDEHGEIERGTRTQMCGVLRGTRYSHDWTTATHDFEEWAEEPLGEAATAPGILQLVYRIVHFAKTRTVSALQQLVELFEKQGVDLLRVLPGQLQAYLPLCDTLDLSEHLRQLWLLNQEQLVNRTL